MILDMSRGNCIVYRVGSQVKIQLPNSGLVGHGVVGVVRHIGPRLVGGGGRGGALPAADVDRGEVLGHLSDLQMAGSAM